MSARPGSTWSLLSLTGGAREIEDRGGLSQLFHQAPTIQVAVPLVAELVEQRPRHREPASGLALVPRHLAAQVLVDRRSGVRQRCLDDAADEPQPIVDAVVCGGGAAVGQHVAADLAKGGLEQKKTHVAGIATGCRPQAVDRRMQDLEPFLEPGKGRMKLEGAIGPGHGLEAREGFLEGREIRKDLVQGGELEDNPHLLIRRRQAELALAVADPLQGRDHRAEARRIDEGDALHVDDDLRRAVLGEVLDGVLQRRRAGDVETAGRGDYADSALGLAGLDFEGHWAAISIWQRGATLAAQRRPDAGVPAPST